MPIINGQKMACAPCIRGHRSTKCNHFNERVMVPVRKPGRPLSTCPCPPGKPCACSGVKVAIPRKQKCGCGPDVGSETDSVSQDRSPIETPASPTRSSFRVSKSSTSSRSNGRKQSFDPANLSRVDPASVNLVIPTRPSLDATTMTMVSAGMVTQPSPSGLSPSGLTPAFEGNMSFVPSPAGTFSPTQGFVYGTPLPYDIGLQYPQLHPVSHQGIKTEELVSPLPPGHINTAMPPPPPYVNGGKHSRSSSLNGQGLLLDLGPPLIPKPNGTANPPTGGSCCGGAKEPNGLPQPQLDFKEPFITQYQTPIDFKQPSIDTSFQFQTIFTYPAHYGSWKHPINPEMWQQATSQPNLAEDAHVPTTPTNGTPGVLGTIHECGCGEGCQCVGCLAHPFNDQMFQYVNNAYTDSNGSRSGSTSSANGGGCCGGNANGDRGIAGSPTQVAAPESPPEAQTPSDGSALGEEQSLPTTDYFFVNIPLRGDGSCEGNINLCPCGDSCQCIGCLVHNALPVSPE